MFDALLVLWIALIGADRIDFLAGEGSLVLTPFLILTPIVLGAELLRIVLHRGYFSVPAAAWRYLLCISVLLCFIVISVLFSTDMEMAVKRGGLLMFQVISTFCVAVALAGREQPGAILRRGAYVGLSIGLAFNVVQLVLWFLGVADVGIVGLVVNPIPHSYAGVLPRLSGQVYDQNRGGLLVLFYLFLLLRFAPPSRVRAAFLMLGIAAMFATLSRSVLLAACVASSIYLLRTRTIVFTRSVLLGACVLGALGAGMLLLSVAGQEVVSGSLEPLSERFSLDEGSASAHLELFQHGIVVATSSIKALLVGIGFGNSFVAVQEFFPGSKYGNFHSLFVTFFAESGIFALAVCVLLFLVPLARGSSYAPLVAGLLAFNIFYQSHAEPAFWFVLTLAWINLADVRNNGPTVAPAFPSGPRVSTAPASAGAV